MTGKVANFVIRRRGAEEVPKHQGQSKAKAKLLERIKANLSTPRTNVDEGDGK